MMFVWVACRRSGFARLTKFHVETVEFLETSPEFLETSPEVVTIRSVQVYLWFRLTFCDL